MTTAVKLPDYDRLAAPSSAAEAERRARDRRERMALGGALLQAAARRQRAEQAVPGFVRRLAALCRPVDPDMVLVHYAVFSDLPLGVLWRPMERAHGLARAEAIYWIFGLTGESAAGVAARFGLDAPSLALQAMRAHARSNGLPVLDVGEDEI